MSQLPGGRLALNPDVPFGGGFLNIGDSDLDSLCSTLFGEVLNKNPNARLDHTMPKKSLHWQVLATQGSTYVLV